MKFSSGISTAVASVALGVSAFAQAPTERPTTQDPSSATTTQMEQQVTVTGCVQAEADYRRMRDQGRGGVAGTGVGVGNEFVLTNASSAGSRSTVGTAGAGATTPTATAGSASAGTMSYELTGPNERQLSEYIGKRVEISGKFKAQEIGPAGPTGGPTAAAPPHGVDVASNDLKLRELEVTSVRAASGSCPAQ